MARWADVIRLGSLPGVTDLGQGYPDVLGSQTAREAAARAVLGDADRGWRASQYAPLGGDRVLVDSLARYYNAVKADRTADPAATENAKAAVTPDNIVVTTSGTEALYVTFQALLEPDDEVIIFEPYFPWYVPHVELAKAKPKLVKLQAPVFAIPVEELKAAITSKTRMIVLNTPHNPTGHAYTAEEVQAVRDLAVEHDLIVLSDEVYETVVFPPHRHIRIADLPDMASRTIVVGSASKMFSLCGWRVGWLVGPPGLMQKIRTMHGYTTYCAPTPLQMGVAAAVDEMVEQGVGKIRPEAANFQENARLLKQALEAMGVTAFEPQGGYFLIADVSALGMDSYAFCQWLAETKKVAAAPLSIFYVTPPERPLVRFAICKRRETILEACRKLQGQPQLDKAV